MKSLRFRQFLLFSFLYFTAVCPGAVPTSEQPRELPGVIVEFVAPGTPAARAGILVGDRLLTYHGKPLLSPASFQALQSNTFGRPTVELRLRRDSETLTLTLPVGGLGIGGRPDLLAAALNLHLAARAAQQANQLDDAVAHWQAAAQIALDAGEGAQAAWLLTEAGSLLGTQRKWKEALETHLRAWGRLKEIPDAAAQSTTLLAIGHCHRSLNDLTAAQRYFEQALQINQAAGFEIWAATLLGQLGTMAYQGGALAAAHDHLSRALTTYERLTPNSPQTAVLLFNLGVVARVRNDLSAAHGFYQRALALNERIAPDSLTVARVLHNLATLASGRGDPIAAQAYCARALAIRERRAPNSLELAHSLNNMGALAHTRGDLDAAQDYHARALAIRERLDPNSMDLAASLNNLGNLGDRRGELAVANDYYRRALLIQERLAPNSLEVAGSLNNLGNVATRRGDVGAARELYSRALAIQQRLEPNSLDVAVSLNNLGNLSRDSDASLATDYYTRALAIQERLAPNSLDVAGSLNSLGILANNRNDMAAAHDFFTRALAIRERLAPGSLDMAASLANLGVVAAARGDRRAAHDYYHRALSIHERMAPNSLDVAIGLNNMGILAYQERRFSEALALFRRATDIVETQRGEIKSAEARALLVAQESSKYLGLARTYVALDDLPSAFATLERARARSLVEMMAERQVDLRSDAPAELLDRQNDLDRRRSLTYAALRRLDPNQEEEKRSALRTEIDRLGREQRDLTAELQQQSPKFAALHYPNPLDLQGARAALDRGTLLLTYFVDTEETLLFAVTHAQLQLFRLKVKADDLHAQVNTFRNAIRVQGAVRRRGTELYDLLVRPAQALTDQAERVLICPDGPLHTLPFAALMEVRGSSGPPAGPASGPRYWADRQPLHLIVSMTTYAELRRPSPRLPSPDGSGAVRELTRLLAFGNPDYPQGGDNNSRGLSLAPLPGTKHEVETIAKLFGKQVTTRLAAAASEAAAKRELASARIIHFACHGLLDHRNPLDSGLALTPDPSPGGNGVKTVGEDGLLQAWEIFRSIKLNADLVVMSACETGLGQTTRNEGIIGLTRALQYAGAKSIVMSLWGVSDDSTAALMTAFYTELRKGTSKDLALQRALASVRKNPKWAHPFYWAPFMLVGDWR